ncbi:sulfotransferase [Spongiibacter sp. KMU-166]|uniref:Sulfotransferase n=1 Tax=Spongiibacter thalassae TaxID=2721624 RepID=A0ABX1GFU8_9GAMM|nr:sulfotransferase [Spongiibacter thalassae]NKI18021.1 sulfotransferase [Spongiibacter thalassae]
MNAPSVELTQALSADALIAEARQLAGLNDFGSNEFYEPLKKLLECVPLGMTPHPEGLASIQADIVRCLVNRLRFQADLTTHPEILDEDVEDPIIVLGLGRSGTTKMQKILSSPDNVQKALFWRLWNPARFPGNNAHSASADPRIAAAGTSNLVATDDPNIHAAHHMEEKEVDEEWLLYTLTFDDWIWNQLLFMPEYFDWVRQRPREQPFAYVKSLLQYLQWQDGGKQDRPWVMKAVGYLADMEPLMACYPRATLLHTHRDPLQTIPSWAKFVSAMWAMRGDPIDKERVGQEVLRYWGMAMDRYLDSRRRLQLDERIVDARYEDVRSNPMSIVERVYQRAGRNITPAAATAMAQWHNTNEQGRFGVHRYSLEEFGLSEAIINDRFAEYIDRFIQR